MSVVQFDLVQWSAWAPTHASSSEVSPVPALEFLPAMQRRRLSALARICFHVCWQVVPPDQACGLVFCSRHGETQRTLDMLGCIQQQEPVSPTAFSHSVHNAIPALLSIARHDIAEQVTIAQQGQDGLAAAFLEASMMLESGSVDQVVVICCDEPLPELFQPYEPRAASYPWAAAFRLQRGQQWRLSLETTVNQATVNQAIINQPTTAQPPAEDYTPAPLQLIATLEQEQHQYALHHHTQCWTWSRHHA